MRKVLLTSALLVAAGAANADSYVGVKSGWTHTQGPDACFASQDCDNDSAGGGLFGGYYLTDWLAIEGGYNYFGEMKAKDANGRHTSQLHGIELGLKPIYSLTDNFSAFGKIGALGWNNNTSGSYNENEAGISTMLGLGFSYDVSKNITLQTEYQWFNDVESSLSQRTDLSFVSLGLVYNFRTEAEPAPVVIAAPVEEEVVEVIEPVFTPTNLEFEFNSATLKANANDALAPLVQHLKAKPASTVTIQAHTDSQGAAAYNQKLSERRAQSVKKNLEAQGIDASRITTEAYGETRPLVKDATKEAHHLNRRVTFVISE